MTNEQSMTMDLRKPMHPMECRACNNFGREIPNVAVVAREIGYNQWLLVCEACRKDLHFSAKKMLKLDVILQ